MKTKFHKKLCLKKVVISIHRIHGGTEDTIKSSAYLEPTEIHRVDDDTRVISQNEETCI